MDSGFLYDLFIFRRFLGITGHVARESICCYLLRYPLVKIDLRFLLALYQTQTRIGSWKRARNNDNYQGRLRPLQG